VQIVYRKIKTLTALIVIINNVYSVELLEFKVSKVNPTNIFINQLLITETLLMSDINVRVCAHALTYDVYMCACMYMYVCVYEV